MGAYKTNTQKNKMIPLELPSSEGQCKVVVPSRLGGGKRADVQALAMKPVQVPPSPEEVEAARKRTEETGIPVEAEHRPMLMFDPTTAGRELFIACCLDPRTWHTIDDENGKRIELTRAWLESELDEDDFVALSQIVLYRLWDQLEGAAPPDGEPKDGDGPLDSSEPLPGTGDTDGAPRRRSKTK